MTGSVPRALLVGSAPAFEHVLEVVEQAGKFQVDLVPATKTARFFLRQKPAVVILHLPRDVHETAHRLEWLASIRHQAPVVILTGSPDASLYRRALSRGAFGCLATISTAEEILRVLDAAVRWHKPSAA